MKTAISLPDELFHAADELAESLGISRSELYASALRELLARRERSAITDQLDAVYGDPESAADSGALALQQAQAGLIRPEKW